MSEVPTNHTLECGSERRIAPARSRHQPDQWNNLEQFLEHERQESELLAELATALETHRKVMDELADAMRLLRESLFLQEDL
jgi:hypothetical protein